MKNLTKVMRKSFFRVCTFVLAVTVLVSALSGCEFLSRFGIGQSDNNAPNSGNHTNQRWDMLDVALIAAAAQKEDNGSFLAEYRYDDQNATLLLAFGGMTATFDLLQYTAYESGIVEDGNRLFTYTSGKLRGDATILGRMTAAYEQHLAMYSGTYTRRIETDADNDGENELILLVNDMLSSFGNSFGAGFGEPLIDGVFGTTGICMYLDYNGYDIVYQTAAYGCTDVSSAQIVNGVLELTDTNGDKHTSWIVDTSKIIEDTYMEYNFRTLCNGYANALVEKGYADVRAKCVDVIPHNGDEVLLCYGDAPNYTFELIAWYQGRPVCVYTFVSSDNSATFLTPFEERYAFFAYQQNFESTYNQNYSYRTVSFNDRYQVVEINSDDITVDLNNNVDDASNHFFKTVMEHMESAIVCYDPYKLTGYTVLPSDQELSSPNPDVRYLSINNCSTNKSGYVIVEDAKSWLSLREGPATSYKRVLMDPSDKKSYVKQSLYTPVTILMPVNTGDNKNPIWVQLQVNYKNSNFIGYSSQKYITIPGIKTLSVGEVFTVTADTNDTGLNWTSSDNSVAYVDPFSGRITARKAGLVLITATTDSNLVDSCLIKIG